MGEAMGFSVNEDCIDCEACMWIAPKTFAEAGSAAYVYTQPSTSAETHRALLALVACPVAAIRTDEPHDVKAAGSAFPDLLAPGVYHCGYHAESSFGAASYLIQRTGGNVLVDSPRFVKPLVRRIEELGGISNIFLTHKDDLADYEKFRDHFGAKVIIHADDARGADADLLIQGPGDHQLAGDLVIIPVPGHTRGSACLLFRDEVLFSGDHLAYDGELGHLYAFRGACWYDWKTQIHSMEKLREHNFDRVLPGHGFPHHASKPEMKESLERCIAWMK
jgi:glyoxylase-like metal-dependent hydrolase (beta-lactamase superfamily II)/ferredoxin